MANGRSFLDRIGAVIAMGTLVAALGSGVVLIGPEDSDFQNLRLAAFNIQIFGKAKLEKDEVMDVLVGIAQEFDVMLVQEVRDATETAADRFLERINEVSELTYAMYESERLGRTRSKEQYVIYYIPSRVQLIDAYILEDPSDAFEREPLVATFRSGNFDFTVVGCHIDPDVAEDELNALAAAVPTILAANPSEQDIILLGDFNADGRYLDESDLTTIFPAATYEIVITDDMVTTTRTSNTYDRIILTDATFLSEYVAGSAQPFEFDWEYGIEDEKLVKKVSDHYPVFAEFNTTLADDD